MPASTMVKNWLRQSTLQFKTAGAAHCVDLVLRDNGEFVTHVPAFGGKVIGEILIPHTRPQIASIKPGLFTAEAAEAKECEVIAVDPAVRWLTKSKIQGDQSCRERARRHSGRRLTSSSAAASVLVPRRNWDKLEELAARWVVPLAARTGCRRRLGSDDSKMIGTSGKGVRPKVYVGFGISGAAHHLCGMKDAGTVVSVNSDGEARSSVLPTTLSLAMVCRLSMRCSRSSKLLRGNAYTQSKRSPFGGSFFMSRCSRALGQRRSRLVLTQRY